MRLLVLALMLLGSPLYAADPWKALQDSTYRISRGTGFIVQAKSTRKYLMTNYHVCIPSLLDGHISGYRADGLTVSGSVKAVSVASDLCIILVPQALSALRLAPAWDKSAQLYTQGYPAGILSRSEGRVLDQVSYETDYAIEAVGECPKGTAKIRDENGIIYACRIRYYNFRTSLHAAPGSSGSPVVDRNGELVGVVESYHSGYGAGIIPYAAIKAFLEAH